jgi:hypothetical protein
MFTSVFFIVFTIVLSPTEHIGLIGPRFDTMQECQADLEVGYNAIHAQATEAGFEDFSLNSHCVEHRLPTNGV